MSWRKRFLCLLVILAISRSLQLNDETKAHNELLTVPERAELSSVNASLAASRRLVTIAQRRAAKVLRSQITVERIVGKQCPFILKVGQAISSCSQGDVVVLLARWNHKHNFFHFLIRSGLFFLNYLLVVYLFLSAPLSPHKSPTGTMRGQTERSRASPLGPSRSWQRSTQRIRRVVRTSHRRLGWFCGGASLPCRKDCIQEILCKSEDKETV